MLAHKLTFGKRPITKQLVKQFVKRIVFYKYKFMIPLTLLMELLIIIDLNFQVREVKIEYSLQK
jgi:hypothetical protein